LVLVCNPAGAKAIRYLANGRFPGAGAGEGSDAAGKGSHRAVAEPMRSHES